MTVALEGGEGLVAHPGRTLPPGKTRYPFYGRMCGPPGPVWTGGKSRPHQDSIPDGPNHSQSLYRLSYPAHYQILQHWESPALSPYSVCLLHVVSTKFSGNFPKLHELAGFRNAEELSRV